MRPTTSVSGLRRRRWSIKGSVLGDIPHPARYRALISPPDSSGPMLNDGFPMTRIHYLITLFAAATAAAVVFAKDKTTEFVNDSAKRAAIKRVAILSVYGPEKMAVGVSLINEQP